MRQRLMPAFAMVFLMMLTPLSGCFGDNEVKSLDTDSLSVSESDSLQAGMWQTITLQASDDLAVFIPYFIQDPGSMRAQNGTVLDMNSGEKMSVNILFPPRNEEIVFFLGDIGRTDWADSRTRSIVDGMAKQSKHWLGCASSRKSRYRRDVAMDSSK